MSEWKEYKLEELVSFRTGKLNSNAAVKGGTYPFFTCSPETLAIDNYSFDCEVLLLAGNNADGNFPLKYYKGKFNAYQRTYLIELLDKNRTTYKYLYYNLLTQLKELKNISGGSATKFLTLPILNGIKILAPDFSEQQQIASVLSSLDDKIDLLHRQNKILEQLAETLFRQWFIEEAEEQSKKQLQLGNLIDSVSITHKFPSDNVIFLNTSDILLGDVLVHESVNINTLPGQAKKTIQKNDILFSEIRPANGRYAYIDFDADNYVVSTKLMVLRSKNIISQAFIYFFLINSQTVDWLQMLAESRSGTFPQITFDQLRNLKINIPSDSILKETVEWCESALQKIKSNTNQIRTLTQLRDTLLPKLMSGEASIR